MTQFSEHSIKKISMSCPSYLRYQKPHPRTTTLEWHFIADRRICKRPHIESLLVSFLDPEMDKAMRFNLAMINPPENIKGVKQRIVRRGSIDSFENGFENLYETSLLINGDIRYRYDIFFLMRGQRVHMDIGGQGELEKFDGLCKTIASSICVL